MKGFRWLVFGMMLGSVAGCARTEKVTAIEGSKDIPYQSLGSLEVKTKARYITPGSVLWTGVEAATLTLANTPSRAERIKNHLRQKLAAAARKHYGADAVIHVEYWPPPEHSKFPEGYVHARGEMIKYTPFGQKREAEQAQSESQPQPAPAV